MVPQTRLKTKMFRVAALVCLLAVLSALAMAEAHTSSPALLLEVTSATRFLPVVAEDTPTSLPRKSVVVGETSSPRTAFHSTLLPAHELLSTRTEIFPGPVVIAGGNHLAAVQPRRLPVKVDKSSTAAQLQQLERFERQNQMGEAYLLACMLVRQNPTAEFAYDAAIRTSIILRQDAVTEDLYLQAIRNARLPGKYFVQLAHYYLRTAQGEKLKKLLSDYEKGQTASPEYWITLVRLYMITQPAASARTSVERALGQKLFYFPLYILASHMYRQLELPEKVRETLLSTPDENFSPWEERQFLLELLKAPGVKPAEIAIMFRAAFANEVSYRSARAFADKLIERCIEVRMFHPLKSWLLQQIAQKKASDVEIWLAALMSRYEGNEAEALKLLLGEGATSTPVISCERAQALSHAGRHREAIPIFYERLREQPTDNSIRLMLAEELLGAGKFSEVLSVLSALPQGSLTPEERRHFCELELSASVAQGDAKAIAAKWQELAQIASFGDIEAMGDVILRHSARQSLGQQLVDVVDEQLKKPESWPLLMLRARLSARELDHRAELRFYSDYLQHDWENVQMLRFVADLAVQYSNLQVAIAPKADTNSSAGKTLRGVDTDQSELAIRFYRRLIELQPRIADNYAALMRVYQMRGEVETAKRVALELSDLDTSSAELQAMAASVLDDCGFAADSLIFYRNSLQIDPANIGVWVRFAAALRDAGEFIESEAIYRKILEEGYLGKTYNQPLIIASLLKLATTARRVPALIDYLDRLRSKDIPGKEEFYLSAAKLFMQVKAEQRAESFLHEFQKLFPKSRLQPDSYLLLVQLYCMEQKTTQTMDLLKQVSEKFPGTPAAISAASSAAEILRRSGKSKEAIASWLALANRYPREEKALACFYLAAQTAYNELKDKELATKLFKLFIDSGPQDFALLKSARQNLERVAAGKPLVESQPAS